MLLCFGLIATGRAQAADLPVKAQAIEYLKSCGIYGPGFYYMPGSDTCMKLGGYVRAATAVGTNNVYNWSGGYNRLTHYFTSHARSEMYVDTRTMTEYGVVRAYSFVEFSWTGGSLFSTAGVVGPATYAGDVIAQGTPGLYGTFIQFAGFTLGKAFSQFDAPWTNYPGNTFDGLVGGSGSVTGVNQFTYTAQFGNGISLAFSAQDPVLYTTAGVQNLNNLSTAGMQLGLNGLNNIGGTRSPDLIAHLRVDQAWGLFQASFAEHLNTPAYYGATEVTGHPDDRWGWAAQLALSIKNLPTGPGDTVNLQAVYTNGATRYDFQSLAFVSYPIYSGTAVPGLYESIGFANAADAVYVGTSGANGSQLENITTWGFRGAYTHNWDPQWSTSIYGAYAAVRYGSLGKNAICAFLSLNQRLVTTCNPDFNIAQTGIVGRWTPVKNLAFTADFNWSRLDQKYAGIWSGTAANIFAKPGGPVYEIKDQNSRTLLLRVQRNF